MAHLPVRKSGSGVGSEISSRHWFSSGTVATTRPSGSCWSKPRAKLFCLETEQTFAFRVSMELLSMQSIFQPTVPKVFLVQKSYLTLRLIWYIWHESGLCIREVKAAERGKPTGKVCSQGREHFPPPQVSILTSPLQIATLWVACVEHREGSGYHKINSDITFIALETQFHWWKWKMLAKSLGHDRNWSLV